MYSYDITVIIDVFPVPVVMKGAWLVIAETLCIQCVHYNVPVRFFCDIT